jgi:hypothetical protein
MRKFFVASLLAFGLSLPLTTGSVEASTHYRHFSNSRHALITEPTQIGIYRVSRSARVYNNRSYKRHAYAAKRNYARSSSVSLARVTPVLAAKAREISASCGSTVISAVSGRPNRSNHPIGRAVDMRGNPGCIYAHLKGWKGGYSTDYRAVNHVHISYNPGGQEWGLRFAHGGHRATRYASAYSRGRAVARLATAYNIYANAYGYGGIRRTRMNRSAIRAMAQPTMQTQVYGLGLHRPL